MNDQENETPPLRVCYFGTYRQQYGRNQILMNGLRANGVDLYECHQPLWQGSEDRVSRAAGKWLDLPFLWRIVKAYLSLIRKHYHAPPYDVMMLGYPGEFDTFLGRLLSWTRRKPLALDHIMSLYLIAIERGLHQKSPLTVKFIRAAEWVSLRLCDLIICDTEGYRDYHCKTYSLTADRFRLVPAGADDRLFFPRPEVTPPTDRFRVMYHGTFLYSHGVETIVAAAALLKDRADIEFLFCGTGPEEPHIRQLAEESGADNIVFTGWVERPEMPTRIASAHLCLGVFGTTKQSRVTMHNKIWESLMMGKAMVTGDSPTVRQNLVHEEHAYLVPRADASALADAILHLKDRPELCETLGRKGCERVQQNNIEGVGSHLSQHLTALVGR